MYSCASLNFSARYGWMVSASPPSLYPPGKSCSTNCTGDGVGPRAGLDGCSEEKVSRWHRGLNPEPSSLHRITIPTTLARPPDNPTEGSQIRCRDLEHCAAQCFTGKWIGCVRSVVSHVETVRL